MSVHLVKIAIKCFSMFFIFKTKDKLFIKLFKSNNFLFYYDKIKLFSGATSHEPQGVFRTQPNAYDGAFL